jgi:hypothetical protein
VSEVGASKPGPMNIGEEASCRSPCPIQPCRLSPPPSASPSWCEASAAPDAAQGVVEVKYAPASAMGGINLGTLCIDDVATPGLAVPMAQDGSRRGGRKPFRLGY